MEVEVKATVEVASREPGTATGSDIKEKPLSVDDAASRLKSMCEQHGIEASITRCYRQTLKFMKSRSETPITDGDLDNIIHKLRYADPTGDTAATRADRRTTWRRHRV